MPNMCGRVRWQSDKPETIFASCDLIVKVKEPQPRERKLLRRGQVLFTYLHLAPDAVQTADLLASGATCIAYETVTSPAGGLPLLTPMSEVAGRLAPQVGAHCLEREAGGRGILLGGVPGVPAAEVVILGGGVVGTHAAAIALGMGANVTVVDRSSEALRRLAFHFGTGVRTIFSTRSAIAEIVKRRRPPDRHGAGAGRGDAEARHPRDARHDEAGRGHRRCRHRSGRMLRILAPDQPFAADLYRGGIVHYCVTNMPGAVPRTSTFALNNATLPFVVALAERGWKKALAEDRHLRAGLNIHDGQVTLKPVADAHGLAWVAAEKVVGLAD